MRKHSALLTEAEDALATFKRAHPDASGVRPLADTASLRLSLLTTLSQQRRHFTRVVQADLKEQRELEARAKHLKELSYTDHGPVYDCVAFHDGEVRASILLQLRCPSPSSPPSHTLAVFFVLQRWVAAVDTTETGDLQQCKLMAEYKCVVMRDGERCAVRPTTDLVSEPFLPLPPFPPRYQQQYDTFTDLDLMNYSFNFYDDGKVLSIVTTSGKQPPLLPRLTLAPPRSIFLLLTPPAGSPAPAPQARTARTLRAWWRRTTPSTPSTTALPPARRLSL